MLHQELITGVSVTSTIAGLDQSACDENLVVMTDIWTYMANANIFTLLHCPYHFQSDWRMPICIKIIQEHVEILVAVDNLCICTLFLALMIRVHIPFHHFPCTNHNSIHLSSSPWVATLPSIL